MKTKAIYVTEQGARLCRRDSLVAVELEGAVVDRWPVDEVSRVLVFGNVQVTTQLLSLLMREGIQVAFFSSGGRDRGQGVSPESGNVFVRLAQHARYMDPDFRLPLARALVHDKIQGARALLLRHRRNHPEAADPIAGAVRTLDQVLPRLAATPDAQVLRGLEGEAAAAYFAVFDTMVRAPFTFERRSKHPAHNPVNAMLNLGYTLLAVEIAGRLEAAGFDPRVGFYHGVRYGRISLALDIMEPFRAAVVDRLTLALLNRRMFTPRDFDAQPTQVRFSPPAFRRYITLFEHAMAETSPTVPSARDRLDQQIAHLRTSVLSGPPAQ